MRIEPYSQALGFCVGWEMGLEKGMAGLKLKSDSIYS
jgi:hypothetical protein